MSAPAPVPDLRQALARALRGRVVVMGIGNAARADDVVGCLVVQRLRRLLDDVQSPPATPRLTLIDAEEIPESWLGPAVAAQPDAVLLVDAVDVGREPGTVVLLPAAELSRAGCCTHRTPLLPLAHYLAAETGADVLLLGVQPGSVELGGSLHPQVAAAAADVAALLHRVLAEAATEPVLPRDGAEATSC